MMMSTVEQGGRRSRFAYDFGLDAKRSVGRFWDWTLKARHKLALVNIEPTMTINGLAAGYQVKESVRKLGDPAYGFGEIGLSVGAPSQDQKRSLQLIKILDKMAFAKI